MRLNKAPFISIAAINGLAFGGGLELALACVFRISAQHAEFALPEVKLGLMPAYAGTQFLPAVVGPSRALDMMVTGRSVSVDEAYQMGLINRVAKGDTPLLDQAKEYLGTITQFSQVAVNAIRESVAVAGMQITEEGLKAEQENVIKAGKSEDAKEGVNAFREKRTAVFKHR
ncbi:MAG: enoyl-CoA hydratase/isomerase family protein [Pseudomonadales bacterium]|nr:enoyl-CoA hydratase/isomerase family protein [Pseudomonadales bacterium]